MSYTTFTYASPKVIHNSSSPLGLTVSLEITNIGSRSGREVIQLYVSPPAGRQRGLPLRTLEGFSKTSELAPNTSYFVEINIDEEAFRHWDEEKHGWSVGDGVYELMIGKSVKDEIYIVEVEVKGRTFVDLV